MVFENLLCAFIESCEQLVDGVWKLTLCIHWELWAVCWWCLKTYSVHSLRAVSSLLMVFENLLCAFIESCEQLVDGVWKLTLCIHWELWAVSSALLMVFENLLCAFIESCEQLVDGVWKLTLCIHWELWAVCWWCLKTYSVHSLRAVSSLLMVFENLLCAFIESCEQFVDGVWKLTLCIHWELWAVLMVFENLLCAFIESCEQLVDGVWKLTLCIHWELWAVLMVFENLLCAFIESCEQLVDGVWKLTLCIHWELWAVCWWCLKTYSVHSLRAAVCWWCLKTYSVHSLRAVSSLLMVFENLLCAFIESCEQLVDGVWKLTLCIHWEHSLRAVWAVHCWWCLKTYSVHSLRAVSSLLTLCIHWELWAVWWCLKTYSVHSLRAVSSLLMVFENLLCAFIESCEQLVDGVWKLTLCIHWELWAACWWCLKTYSVHSLRAVSSLLMVFENLLCAFIESCEQLVDGVWKLTLCIHWELWAACWWCLKTYSVHSLRAVSSLLMVFENLLCAFIESCEQLVDGVWKLTLCIHWELWAACWWCLKTYSVHSLRAVSSLLMVFENLLCAFIESREQLVDGVRVHLQTGLGCIGWLENLRDCCDSVGHHLW